MRIHKIRSALIAVMTLTTGLLHASEASVPVVYQDEFITIHAGVPAVGSRPLHIGDRISLVFELEFDPRRLQPQVLDGDFFVRSFTEQRNIALIEEPKFVETELGSKREVRVTWPFQILGCPGAATSCPGARNYELPTVSLAYQLLDEAGNTLNHKAARFRPWPGSIGITPTLVMPANETGFSAYFPDGAYPQAASTGMGNGLSWLAAMLGLGLLAVAIAKAPVRRLSVTSSAGDTTSSLRWQRALAAVAGTSPGDAERSDLLRRSVTWYCLDELGQNPYQWLREGGEAGGSMESRASAIRNLFMDLLQRDRIDRKELDGYLQRFADASGGTAIIKGQEQTA